MSEGMVSVDTASPGDLGKQEHQSPITLIRLLIGLQRDEVRAAAGVADNGFDRLDLSPGLHLT